MFTYQLTLLTPSHPQLPLYTQKSQKKKKKKIITAGFNSADNVIAGIQIVPCRLAWNKLVTLQAPRNTPKLPLYWFRKKAKKILMPRFLRSPIILFPKYHF